MIRSMTGFGKAACDVNGRTVSVEVSSVNHRYLDCSARVPMAWVALEPVVKQVVREHLSRGKVNVTVNRKRAQTTGQAVRLDRELARQYVDASKELGQLLGACEPLSLSVLAQMDGVFFQEEEDEDLETAKELVTAVVGEALKKLDAMRAQEGQALADDLRRRLSHMRTVLASIEERLPALNERYETRLRTRIEELKSDLSLTEERIAIEVALMAEKGDVTEEVVRLRTHLDHAEELLSSGEAVGRRLDFLAQEIQREVNTLGVKTRDADVAKEILGMKAELEKIREQVQNIE
ncbi:MAG TPA: YicC family protein [Candidatus Hydrogenedentes bacterium]|nr:YicC family protein [Candidatus Hydrogenedentota bacterium]